MASKEVDVEAGEGTALRTLHVAKGSDQPTTKLEAVDTVSPNEPSTANEASNEAAQDAALLGDVPPPNDEPNPPPDGGVHAWMAVVGGFFFSFSSLGLTESFAIFQKEYSADILKMSSNAAISFIGTIQTFVMFVVAVLCAKALDCGYGYYYLIAMIGVPVEVFGFMMASLASKYWSIILSQGILVGIGAGMVLMPSIYVVSSYFSTWRATALAISLSGSSVGGIIYPPVLHIISSFIGLHWAMRIMAFVMLGTLCLGLLVTRPRKDRPKSGPLFNFRLFRILLFGLFLGAVLPLVIGLYVPYFYIVQYGTSIGKSEGTATHMLMLLNAAAVVGRIGPALLSRKIGTLTTLIISTGSSCVIVLAWMAVKSTVGLIIVSIFYGLASGTTQVMILAAVSDLLPDPLMASTGMGLTMLVTALGSLIGSPIAGAIVNAQTKGDSLVLWGALLFTGLSLFVGASLILVVRIGASLAWLENH